MIRRSRLIKCFSGINENSRVGIFPLHLDPPTIQHCEIFRLLVSKRASDIDGGKLGPTVPFGTSHIATSTPPPFSSKVQPATTKSLHLGRLKHNALNDSNVCESVLARSSLLEHFEDFDRIVSESSLAPFDHLILVPNTKFPVTLRQSIQLAAMSVLAVRGMPRVHVDLKALEHPDEMMPVISELVSKYPRSTLVHWLPNVYEMQLWKNFDELAKQVPFLLLRPKGWRSPSEAALQDAISAAMDNNSESRTGDKAPVEPPAGTTTATGSSATTGPSASGETSAPPEDDDNMCLHRIADTYNLKKLLPRQWDTSSTPTRMEILEVPRMSGSYTRQSLWEGSTDPKLLLPPAVLRFIDSHGLYRDFRKGTAQRLSQLHRSKAAQTHTFAAHTSFAFEGLIPRLELHYDPNNLLAREQYKKLRVFECLDGQDPDLIVPIGGDGYFMHCVRKNWRRFIPFFGVNAGHVGYLLNDCQYLDDLISAPLKLYQLSMLYCEAEAETATGEKQILEQLAFNDAWVERATGQTALIRILVNGEERIRRVRGDGVLMSTAAGTTAYAQALGASPVPVGAPLIQLVGSNVVSPLHWRPVHLNIEDCVEFECVDSVKRPCRGFVDSVDVGIVSRMLIRTSRVAGVQVAFADRCDLQQKLYSLQFPTSY